MHNFKKFKNIFIYFIKFLVLIPDILHWLRITKIDKFLSMSNMIYDVMVNSGINILEKYIIFLIYYKKNFKFIDVAFLMNQLLWM